MTTRTLRAFEYLEPMSVKEAVSMLAKHRGEAKILAGGTDLLPFMKMRMLKPSYVVNIKKIPNLDYVKYSVKGGLRIGALTTFRNVEKSELIKEKYPLLLDAATTMGSTQVRNVATVAGNICNASPAADMAPPLLVLDSRLRIAGRRGERTIPLENFFAGPDKNVLDPAEMLTEIQSRSLPRGTGTAFLKIGRVSMDLAKVSVAVAFRSVKGTCESLRIALGATAPTPIRAKRAEKLLEGRRLDDKVIEEAAQTASDEAKPRPSLRSTVEYKREAVRVLVRRAMQTALSRVS